MTHNEYILIIILSFIVSNIPLVGKYISVLNTLFHELGHAIFALLFNGKVQSISLFANTGGLAITSYRSWFGKVFIALAGYPSSSLTAFLCFDLIYHHKTHYVLYGFIGATVFALLFWIRNAYGFLWAITFTALCGTLIYYGTSSLQEGVTVFLAGVIFSQAISSAFTIFRLSLIAPKDAGDATILSEATWIPSVIWGLFFLVQSLYFAYLTLKFFIL